MNIGFNREIAADRCSVGKLMSFYYLKGKKDDN